MSQARLKKKLGMNEKPKYWKGDRGAYIYKGPRKEKLLPPRLTDWQRDQLDKESNKDAYQQTPAEKLATYIWSARSYNQEWNISDKEVLALFQQPCTYCEAPPAPLNGIDRLHGKGPYNSGNCVSCCKSCRKDKGPMSYEEFEKVTLKRAEVMRKRAVMNAEVMSIFVPGNTEQI